ncbi:MAG: hypothetical protein SGARI_005007, partial [Bacillariaceae sp.]
MRAILATFVVAWSFSVVSGFVGTGGPLKNGLVAKAPIQKISPLKLPTARDDVPLVPPLFSKTELQASTVAGGDDRRNILQQWSSGVSSVLQKLAWNIRHDEITQWRCAALAFVASIAIFHQRIDLALVKLWNYLSTSNGWWARAFRHDHWEWLLAVACFNVYIHGFGMADKAVLTAARQGRDHPLRKHRLQDRLVAQKHRQQLVQRQKAGEDVNANEPPPAVTDHSDWHNGGYFPVRMKDGKLEFGELWVYMVPLFIWDRLDPRRHRLMARFVAPTALQIVRDVTLSLLMYDFLFFCGHVIMHKIPFINRRIHSKHHITPEVRSGDIVRLTVLEQVLEVGFSIVAIRTLKSHP